MKWLGVKRIAIKSIVLPGNFSATKAAPRITALATLVRRTDGLIHHPVVEAKTMRLLAGHDRIAAVMQLGDKHVEARIWEGTPQEFREIQVIENLGRRADDPNALTAELVRIEAGIIAEQRVEGGSSDPPSQSVKHEARKRVAAAKGITPEGVRTAEKRDKAKQRAAAKVEEASAAKVAEGDAVVSDAALAAPLPEGFNAFGLEVAPDHRERIAELAQALGAWSRMTTNLLTELARVAKVANPPLLSRQAAEAIKDKARALGHVIREAIPTSLCFYCKNDDRAVVDCAACGATGLAGRHAGDNVPPELKTQGVKARIALDGQFVPVPGVAPSPTGILTGGSKHGPAVGAKPASKRGIRVVAVDAAGNEVYVPLEDDAEELAF